MVWMGQALNFPDEYDTNPSETASMRSVSKDGEDDVTASISESVQILGSIILFLFLMLPGMGMGLYGAHCARYLRQ